MENLFVNIVRLNKDNIDNIDNSKYPFNIKCLSSFDELKINYDALEEKMKTR